MGAPRSMNDKREALMGTGMIESGAYIYPHESIRRSDPHALRRTPLYPFVPVFFILMSMVIIWNAVSERPLEAGLGIATVLTGTPLYLLWRRLSIGSHS